MGRDTGPKDRQSRRIGEKLFLKGQRDFSQKSGIVKRNYPPGLHGPKQTMRKVTDFGKQLMAKQKIKKMYRLREKQFVKYYKEASRQKGDASVNLLTLLEKRLDNVVFRLGLAESRDQARQLVTHGHFLVNDQKVNIPSYKMKVGDKVTVRESSSKNTFFKQVFAEIAKRDKADWVNYDEKTFTGKVIGDPEVEELNLHNDAVMTVEFYSR